MHLHHQLLKILLQPFIRLCLLRRPGVQLVPERYDDFHELDFRTLDKALHVPTHHQLCSTQLLQGDLNLRCETRPWKSSAPKTVVAGTPDIASL